MLHDDLSTILRIRARCLGPLMWPCTYTAVPFLAIGIAIRLSTNAEAQKGGRRWPALRSVSVPWEVHFGYLMSLLLCSSEAPTKAIYGP